MMENIDPSVYERADEGLLRLIEKAKVGALSENEYKVYEASLKALADEMDMEEHGYARGLEAGRKEGIEEGRKEGIEAGRKEGIEAGRKEGIETGRKEGIETGRMEGIETGIKKGISATVRMFAEGGIPISEIAKILHIPEEEVNSMLI